MINKKSFLLYFFCLLILLISCTSRHYSGVMKSEPSTNAFSVNGWQLHEWNVPKTIEAIKKAPAYGVNMLIFSHDINRSSY